MKIFVINLERSKDRKEYMEKHLGDLGIEFEFFKAVEGMALSPKTRDMLWDQKAAFDNFRTLIPNELGCALSHMHIFEKMVTENISEAFIFEDDVIVDKEFKNLLDSRKEWMPNDTEMVMFGHNNGMWYKEQDRINIPENKKLGVVYQMVGGGYGYYITLSAVKKILQKSLPLKNSYDNIIGDPLLCGHKIYMIKPPVVHFKREESTIDTNADARTFGPHVRRPLLTMREYYRIHNSKCPNLLKCYLSTRSHIRRKLGLKDAFYSEAKYN